jgi:RND family efflux transporter MFP subunit
MPRLNRMLVLAACLTVVPPVSLAAADGRRDAEGVTEAVVDVTLSLSVPGIVWRQNFEEGDLVSSNEVILELEHQFDDLECERRKLVMDNRKRDWEATKIVYERSQSVSLEELNKKELEYRVAVVEHAMAREQVALRQLRAPASGVLVDLRLDSGEASEAYQPLARIVDSRQCYFISNLDYRVASRLKLGQVVQLQIDDDAAPEPVTGKVVFLSPVVDPASGLQELKVLFDNSQSRIRPGVSGRLLLPREP